MRRTEEEQMDTKMMSTAIGSMPFEDPDYAVQVSLNSLDAPIWPQLPRLGLREQMEIQYSENIPCVVIDEVKKRMYLDTSKDYSESFALFYENYMTAMDPDAGNRDCSSMAITEEYSKGLYAFERALIKRGGKLPFAKVQATGPCSFALTLVDENKRAIYYNEEFRDMITKALAMKCCWQVQKFKAYAEKVICFVDEPILSAFGSSTYVSVSREDIVAMLNEVIESIHRDDGIVGIHCCGNTEWSILVDAGVDMINFDAFGYGDTIAMYPEKIKTHLERGGMLAAGVVPTSSIIMDQTVETLEAQLEKVMDDLAATGIKKDLIVNGTVLTPACGTGSLEIAEAEKVFQMLKALSTRMKEKYA